MLFTYARRELTRRRRQTVIVAAGLAIAVALVMVVNSVSAGVRAAQADVLTSIYGVGTDITVTQRGEFAGMGGRMFEFNQDQGATDEEGATRLASSILVLTRGSAAFPSADLAAIAAVDGVAGAVGALELELVDFSGELPGMGTEGAPTPEPGTGPREGDPDAEARGGFGGGAFSFDQTTVTGVEPGAVDLGPLASATATAGRLLEESDAGAQVAVLSAPYAEAQSLGVGDTITVSTTELAVVGVVDSTTVTDLPDIHLPLDVAQSVAGLEDQVSEVYVQAVSSTEVDAVAAGIEAALPEATVATQSELANSVSGTVSSASSLLSSFGTWLSLAVLLVAFLMAVLFTVAGVNRRTRDFGTLKAIGWSDRRITGQVATESLLQAAIGGAVGVALGLGIVGIVNALGITLSGTTGAVAMGGGPGSGRGQGLEGAAPGMEGAAIALGDAVDVVLSSPIDLQMVGIGFGVALLGGLLAAAIGGWRAARLRPAEALRSVE